MPSKTTMRRFRELYLAGQLSPDDIRELFATRRSICFSQLTVFRDCPHRFLGKVLGIRDGKVVAEAVIGEACHIVAQHKGDLAACILEVKAEIESLPPEDQPEAFEKVQKLIANRAQMSDAGDNDESAKREQVLKWTDDGPDGTGWTFCAKPDRYRVYRDARGPVLEILDEKTSERTTGKHREQLCFFGVVVKAALGHTGSVLLKGLCWGATKEKRSDSKGDSKGVSKGVFERFYQRDRQGSDLEAWRKEIRKIEEYIAAGHFPAKDSHVCKGCPLATVCSTGIAYMLRVNGRWPATQPVVAPAATTEVAPVPAVAAQEAMEVVPVIEVVPAAEALEVAEVA